MDAAAAADAEPAMSTGRAARAAAPGGGPLRAPPQLALLGTGEAWMERALQALGASFPGRAAGIAAFSEAARARSLAAPPPHPAWPAAACVAAPDGVPTPADLSEQGPLPGPLVPC